jgi:hypothetical protein
MTLFVLACGAMPRQHSVYRSNRVWGSLCSPDSWGSTQMKDGDAVDVSSTQSPISWVAKVWSYTNNNAGAIR